MLYTKFPNIQIEQEETKKDIQDKSHIFSYQLEKSVHFPLKIVFDELNDPYMVLSALLSKLEHFNEKVQLQLIITPSSESWWQQFFREKFFMVFGLWNNIKLFLKDPFLEKTYIDYYQVLKDKYDPKLFKVK